MSTEHPANYLTTCAGDSGQVQASLDEFLASMKEQLGGENPTELTIASGSITPTSGAHSVTAASSPTDLTNVVAANLMDGQLLLLWPAAEDKTITVNHEAGGAGQIHLNCSHDLVLDDTDNYVLLQRQGDDWYEAARMGDIVDPADMKRLEATDSGVKLSQEGDQIDLNKGSVKIDAEAGGADHTASGITMAMTAGGALNFGDICYLDSSGELQKANADSAFTMPATFMALEDMDANDVKDVLVHGVARDDNWSWTTGGVVYTSATAGGLTQTAPSGSGEYVQAVGLATNATRMLFDPAKPLMEVIPLSPWESWDETSEAGLASSDTFVTFMANTTAGGDETGQGGGYTGLDLTVTDKNSSIGGASGSPSVRAHSGNDVFLPSINVTQDIVNNNQCCIIIKVDTFVNASVSADYFWIDDYPASPRCTIQWGHKGTSTGSKMMLYVEDDTGIIANSLTTTNAMPTTGNLWICFMCGSGYLRAGFCTSKPTKWSDFATGDRVGNSTTPQFSHGAYRTGAVGPGWPMSTSGRLTFNSHYCVMSKQELLDPNS